MAQCGRECGQPVSLLSRAVSLENKKTLETLSFQGFCVGGDKRDRTADLLNAMGFAPESDGFLFKKQQIIDIFSNKSFHYTSIGI